MIFLDLRYSLLLSTAAKQKQKKQKQKKPAVLLAMQGSSFEESYRIESWLMAIGL